MGVHPKQAQHSNANTHRQRAQPSKPSSGFEAFPSQMLLPPSSNKPSNSHRYYYRAVLGYILCYTSRLRHGHRLGCDVVILGRLAFGLTFYQLHRDRVELLGEGHLGTVHGMVYLKIRSDSSRLFRL